MTQYIPLHFDPCELLPDLPSISDSLPAALAIGLRSRYIGVVYRTGSVLKVRVS